MSNLGGENTQSVDDKGKEESQGCSADNVILRIGEGELNLSVIRFPLGISMTFVLLGWFYGVSHLNSMNPSFISQ